MEKHFTHLHLHTEYSLLDGAIKLPQLLKFAKQQQWKAIGISDHGNVFGAVKFFQQAKKEGIKPVLGIEMYFTPDVGIKNAKEKYHHLILIVQNTQGYKNLCKLIAYAHQTGFYFKPRIDYAILEKHSAGLIATTACVGGHIPTLLRDGDIAEAQQRTQWFKDVFGPDRFYFEVQPLEIQEQVVTNRLLAQYAGEWGVKMSSGCDAHYLLEEDKQAHEVLLAIQTKDVLSNPDRFSLQDCSLYVRTTQQMLDGLKEYEEAVWNTGVIADQCDFQFEFGKLFFPHFPVPEGMTQEQHFEALCHTGLEKIKDQELIPIDEYDRYKERLELEIALIIKMGFVGYFLVVSDFIQWGKKQGIPIGAGRGSAAGSLVAWALEITNVDPLKYNLLFERFLNPERISMPDIDIDFCIERREEVINYCKDKYGHDCVCQIITFGTMMAKGVIKDVARALGFPFQDANMITDLVPEQLKITLNDAIEQEPKLKELIASNSQIKHLMDICFKLEGLTRHASKHAAGIVIAPERLDEIMPLFIPSKSTDLVAQYAMTELEYLGFLKMDFLGLKNLTVIDRALKAIERNHGLKINLDKIQLDDAAAFRLLCQGKTNGVFQFESDGLQDVLRKLQPDKFEDLIAVNALYRPGPLGSGMVEDYIERRHGRRETTYMFKELEPILSETYGVIVYQEQVMKIASAIGGYTLGGADILRRAMGKKKAEVMAEQKALFVAGAEKQNFDTKKAGELFDLMAYFAGYGFNKSHSTAYALIAYHTAYLKANYPHEFMAALVSFETDNPDQLTYYLQEINDMGIKTTPPNVMQSDIEFTATAEGIVFGLQGIKSIGLIALKSILEERAKKPFTDLLDFCKRVDLRTVNKRTIENLIYAGAMDIFPGNRAQKVAELEKIIDLAHTSKDAAKTGQMGIFMTAATPGNADAPTPAYLFQPLDEFSDKEKLEKEKEVVGIYLSSHPLKSYPGATWIEHLSFSQALEKIKDVTSLKEPFVTCLGLLSSHRVITTKKGDKMAFAQCEDTTGHGEIVIFPQLFAKVETLLSSHNVFIIKGTLDITSQTKCKIKANELIPLDGFFEKTDTKMTLIVDLPSVTEATVSDLKNHLQPGTAPLHLRFKENNQTVILASYQKVACTQDACKALASAHFGVKIAL